MDRTTNRFLIAIWGLSLLLLKIGILVAAENPAQHKHQNCHLTVGWSNWPPYQYLSENGELKGLQIYLLDQIARQVNCKFDYVQQKFSKNMEDIEVGKIDMMPDITITEQRRKFGTFSKSYRTEMQILYVKKENLSSCENKPIREVLASGFRLGLAKRNRYGDEIESIRKASQYQNSLVSLEHNNIGFEAMLKNRIDGYFEDPAVIAYLSEKRHLKNKIASCRIQVYLGKVSLMFSRKTIDGELVSRIDNAIDVIKQKAFYKKHWQW